MLSLGGEEAIATIGADGKVIFENPEHLNLLTEEDLLSLRLYLNGDAGNVLWEYQMAGFGPFWSIYPNQQPHAIRKPNSPVNASAETVTAADGDSYYMLGGMRIKVLFQTEQDSSLGEALSVTWKVEDASGSLLSDNIGNFYPDNNPASDSLGKTYNVSSATNPDEALFETYYQPEQWRTDLDVKITAQVRYSRQSTPKNYSISLKSRELYPVTADNPNIYNSEDSQAPLKGSDVAMLEGLLWQLGLSGQYNSPGKGAARINSDRGTFNNTVLGWTKNCQGEEARARDIYSVGWDSTCADEARENGVSMEGMVRRFQGRSFDVPNSDREYVNLKGRTDTAKIHGRVDDETLAQLGKVWAHYRQAVFTYPSPQYRTNNLAAEIWPTAVTMLTSGGRVPYENSPAYNILASYTDVQHASVKINFPEAANGFTIEGLIRAWTKQESGNIHWGGTDSKPAIYRLYEGSADEQGSMGFNHIVWKRLYGTENDCDEVRGYIGDTSNVNMYNPINSLYGLVVAGSHAQCSSSNGLHEAFVDGDYATNIPTEDRPSAYCYEGIDINSESNENVKCANVIDNNRAVHDFAATQDAGMHLLGEAMAGYNAGSRYPDPVTPGTQVLHYFGDRMLDSTRSVTGNDDYVRTRFGYWMAIKGHTQDDDQPGYLPYTTYIWPNNLTGAAALGVDLNRDGTIATVANADGVIEANTAWCYAYGELDWMSPFQRENDAGNLVDATRENYLERAEQVTSFRVRCI